MSDYKQKLDDFMNLGVGLEIAKVCDHTSQVVAKKYENVNEQKQNKYQEKFTSCKVNDL